MFYFQLLLFISLLPVLAIIYYSTVWESLNILKKIPGPKSLPFIGNSWHFITTPEKLFQYLRVVYRTFGNISQIHGFNFKAINIYNPDDIEKIMSSVRYNNKQAPYTFLRSWLGEGLLISNGIKWHQRRKLLTGAFHFNILKKYARTFSEKSELFLKMVEEETEKEKTDVIPLISNTTLHIMCETAMGTSMRFGIRTVIKKYFEAIYIFGESTVMRICRIWLHFDVLFLFTKMFWLQEKAVNDLHKFTEKIIEERRIYVEKNIDYNVNNDKKERSNKGRLAMLDLLLQKEKEGKIDLRGIREEVDTFMFEGHDTTAMALSLMIMRIANEPEIQEKIYEEMVKTVGESNRSPTTEETKHMKYLECCIKESLRLYPSVPFIARYITQETVLSGYTIPANTVCHIFVYDLHRRADLFPDPEKFIPERFLPENTHKRHPFSYIPFSAGPRNCIGQRFAMLEMKTLMSGLLRNYRIEPVTKPSDLVFKADIVLRTNHPVYVRFRKRI